jgi:thiosulfate dehydrogenase [quinone] large subunit
MDPSSAPLNAWQQFLLVTLRFAVGWHLFYQGLGKLTAVRWSAAGYLRGATGPFDSWFHRLAASGTWVMVADRATVWGLMLVGLLLMVGLFTRAAALGAIALLALFYLAQPALSDHGFGRATVDGYELYVNKVVIEILALAVVGLAFHTGRISGLDLLLGRWTARSRARRDAMPEPIPSGAAEETRRISL